MISVDNTTGVRPAYFHCMDIAAVWTACQHSEFTVVHRTVAYVGVRSRSTYHWTAAPKHAGDTVSGKLQCILSLGHCCLLY